MWDSMNTSISQSISSLSFIAVVLSFETIAVVCMQSPCQFHLSNNVSKVCGININMELTADTPGLSLRHELGGRFQNFFDIHLICGDRQALLHDLLHSVLASELHESRVDEYALYQSEFWRWWSRRKRRRIDEGKHVCSGWISWEFWRMRCFENLKSMELIQPCQVES